LKSIKYKLIFALAIGIIIVLLFVTFNNNRISKITEKNNEAVLNNISRLSNEYIGYRVDKSNDIALILSNNSHLNAISKKSIVGEVETNSSLSSLVNDIMYQAELNDEIASIFIYFKEEQIFMDSYRNIYQQSYLNNIEWIQKYAKGNEPIKWMVTSDSRYENSHLISMIYRADKFNSNVSSPIYVSINYNQDEFFDIISRTKLDDQTTVALVNFDDDIFVCDVNTLSKIDIRKIVYDKKEYLKKNNILRVNIVNLGQCDLIYTKLDAFDGAIIHIIPDKFTEVISQSERIFLISLGALALIGYLLWILYFVKKNIDRPIAILLKNMKITGKGQFSKTIKINRKDEFGQLFLAYNNMLNEIDNLIQKLYREQLVKSELELKVLQEKINPHFLYNTLDTINWMAKEHNITEISDIVINLSSMYRMTFNKGKDLITIDNMILGISCYLSIQKLRFGDTFHYEINFDEELMEYKVLNLIVQTIVENSIVHGISELEQNGTITISGHIKFSVIHIIVEDNGVGMSSEKLHLINESINSEMIVSESGLRNVQKRIKLYYGNTYGINIESELNQGTKITITIPYEEAL